MGSSEQAPSTAAGHSILAAYCGEVEKLTTTLVELLDVAARGGPGQSGADVDALRRLTPAMDRLADRVRGLIGDPLAEVSAPQPPSIRPGAGGPFGRSLVEEMCRPALEASVSRMLGGDHDAAQSGDLALSEGPGNFPDLADDEPDGRMFDGTAGPLGVVSLPPRAEDEADSPQSMCEVEPIPSDQVFETLMGEVHGQASLQGTSASLPIQPLIELIGSSRKTGRLHLRTSHDHLRIEFEKGEVVATSMPIESQRQRMGDLAIRLGFLSKESCEAALVIATRDVKPLGAVLVESGKLSVEQLSEVLQFQLESRFDRVFRAGFVAYAFVPHAPDETDGRLRMDARELLLQSARRVDESDRDPAAK